MFVEGASPVEEIWDQRGNLLEGREGRETTVRKEMRRKEKEEESSNNNIKQRCRKCVCVWGGGGALAPTKGTYTKNKTWIESHINYIPFKEKESYQKLNFAYIPLAPTFINWGFYKYAIREYQGNIVRGWKSVCFFYYSGENTGELIGRGGISNSIPVIYKRSWNDMIFRDFFSNYL